eukprot:13087-Heterococcus_DN1.PRE.2
MKTGFLEESDASSSSESEEERKTDRLSVNKKFAQQFEDRKRKEALEQLQALEGSDGSAESYSESDESEDEDGEQLTLGLDLEIMRTINRIRKKVSIYSKANNSDCASAKGLQTKRAVDKPFGTGSYSSVRFFKAPEGGSDGSSDSSDEAVTSTKQLSCAASVHKMWQYNNSSSCNSSTSNSTSNSIQFKNAAAAAAAVVIVTLATSLQHCSILH